MKGNSDNKKSPIPASKATGEVDQKYYTITLAHDGTGNHSYDPLDFKESLEKSFTETFNSTGGYTSREAHDKTEMSASFGYEKRDYNIGGTSSTTETHNQTFVEDTNTCSTGGDFGRDTLGRELSCSAGQKVAAAGAPSVFVTATTSKNPQMHAASGDSANDFDGNLYYSVGGDSVRTIKNNDIGIVAEGDYSRHIQSGSWDTHIKSGQTHANSGQARLYADNDILIESATKIVLKVGTSTITITSANVEILANGGSGRIDLNN